MLRKFLVFSEEQLHEYTITSESRKDGSIVYKLFYSHGEQWSETTKGEQCLKIIEDDLEMEIIDKKKGKRPYCEIAQLKLLIDFITSDTKEEYKIIEEKDILIIK